MEIVVPTHGVKLMCMYQYVHVSVTYHQLLITSSYHQLLLLQKKRIMCLPPVITTSYYHQLLLISIVKCLPMLGVWRLGGLVTPAFPFMVNFACSSSSNTEGECWVAAG